jgi:SAM-dependent methyltransferase
MKYHGYICYNSKDLSRVEDFYDLLSATGLKMFFDKRDKPAGQSTDKIINGLNDSQCLLIFISRNEFSETWQKMELDLFIINHYTSDITRKIMVVVLEHVSNDTFPQIIRGFERYEYFDKENYNSEQIYKLTQELQPTAELYNRLQIERPLLKNIYKDALLKPTLQWYSDNAELFFETWKDELPERALQSFIIEVKKIKKGTAKILDSGCGPGHHSVFFGKDGFEVVGIDFAHKAIDIAKKNKIANTTFIYGDMRQLETVFKGERNIFDGIWASGSLVHINSEALVLQFHQFMAHLKPSGILGVTFQIGFDSEQQEDGRFFERYKNELIIQKELERANFSILNKSVDYSGKSTTRKKIKTWVCFIAQAPKEKLSLSSKPRSHW